jgi:hypothetical protein
MFKVGDFIKRKRFQNSLSIIINEDDNNYTLYNNKTRRIQSIAKLVIRETYIHCRR